MIGKIIAASARNPMLVLIGTFFAVIAGLYAILHTPLDAIPDLSDTQVIVYTEYPGQAPQVSSFELVEINPRHDRDGQSVRWAALVIWSFLIGLAQRQRPA